MQFVEVWRAETIKLFSRTTAKVGLVLAAGLGVAGPIAMWLIMNAGMTVNGADVAQSMNTTAPDAMLWALNIRNFFVMKAMIIALAALSFASEYRSRTIREDLLRPVARWNLPVAKWLALVTWSAATVVVSLVFGTLLSVIVFGFHGDWIAPLVGWLLNIPADAGVASIALLVSVASRSVVGTVGGVFLLAVIEWFFSLFLTVVAMASGLFTSFGVELASWMQKVVELKPWLPSAAFDFWKGINEGTDWEWRSMASLLIVTAVSVVLSERIFDRVDVP